MAFPARASRATSRSRSASRLRPAATCALAAHADPVDAGAAVRARVAARRRRRPSRRRRPARYVGPVDHRHVARALLHAGGACSRSRGSGICSPPGAAFAIALGYVSGVALARLARHRPHHGDLRERARRRGRDGDAGRALRRAHRPRRRRAEPAHPDRRRDRAGAPSRRSACTAPTPTCRARGASTRGGFALLMAATLAGGVRLARTAPAQRVRARLARRGDPAHRRTRSTSRSLPPLVSNAGQCLLGCALGSRFQRGLPRAARSASSPRWSRPSLLSIVLSAAVRRRARVGGRRAAGADAGARAPRPAASPRWRSPPRCCSSACRW